MTADPPPTAPADASIRLDRWLWQARFCKSRSLAAKLCTAGRVRIDGRVVDKAHAAVRPGQVLTFALHDHVRVIRVAALGTRRGPAPEARTLYEDLSPPRPETRLPPGDAAPPRRTAGSGRPTKKERRAMERLSLGVDTPDGGT